MHTCVCTYNNYESTNDAINLQTIFCYCMWFSVSNLIYIDKVDDGSQCSVLNKLAIFEENYALLSNTSTDIVDPLLKCFEDQNFFTTEVKMQIGDSTTAAHKLHLMLSNISSSLRLNDTRGFDIMVKIMKEHGDKTSSCLADHIMKRLKLLPCTEVSYSCSSVPNDKPKG